MDRPTSAFQRGRCCSVLLTPASMRTSSLRLVRIRARHRQRRKRSVLPGPGICSRLPGRPEDYVESQSSRGAELDKSLLVIGPGVLGTYLGKLWLDEIHGAVIGQSLTDNSHERLRAVGITPRLTSEASGSFSWVVFCAPISRVEDVKEEMNRALSLWDKRGSFVYTSSIGVYPDSGEMNEDSPLKPDGSSERVDRMLLAERLVLEGGGNVLRLAGLYNANRGAHMVFGRMGNVDRPGDYLVNLIHYEDAASLVLKVLLGTRSTLSGEDHGAFRSKVFLGTDGVPVTFQAMMDAASTAGVCPSGIKFLGAGGVSKSKELDNTKTRHILGTWAPKYRSFIEFMTAGGKDWYSTCGLF